MDDDKNQIKPFSWGFKSGKISLIKSCIPSPYSYLSDSNKEGKFENWTVIDDLTVTFLIQFWYPQVSNLRYLSFSPLIFNPDLNKITTI